MYIEERLRTLERRVAALERGNIMCGNAERAGDTSISRYALIEAIVAAHLGIPKETFRRRQKPQSIAWARQLVHALAVEFLPLSLVEIGALAFRDHGTIIHSRRVVENRCETSAADRSLREAIRTELRREISRLQTPQFPTPIAESKA